jgi:ABC-type sugar transport system ATPase subunit
VSWVKNFTVSLGREARISLPDFELPEAGLVGLMGPSGSGKSTVVRVLLGLQPAPGVRWEWGSEDLCLLPVQARNLSVVFQQPALFPHLTARENLQFAADARNVSKEDASTLIDRLTQSLGMGLFLERKASRLSGGEKQRVALGRALMGRPRFLFLDEPFSALDAELKAETRALTAALLQEFKIPGLLITHDEEDATALRVRKIFRIGSRTPFPFSLSE